MIFDIDKNKQETSAKYKNFQKTFIIQGVSQICVKYIYAI